MEEQGGHWLYLVGVAFALGILIRSFYEIPLPMIVWIAMVALALALVRRGRTAPFVIVASLVLFCFSLGLLRMEWASWSATDPYLEARVESVVILEGVVRREPEERETNIHLYVRTEHGLILITTEKGASWRYGDRIKAEGMLKKPEPFETDLGRTFNYPGYLLAKGVSYTIQSAEVAKLSSNEGFFLIGTIFDLKRSFMKRIERLLPEPQVGLGEGLLLGVKRALGEELEETFRRTGIIHIVVLSGYNVMLVVAFILYVLGSLFGRRLSTVFGIVGIALFAIMVGLGATVVRASIMATLLLVLGLTGRVYLVLRGLVVAGMIMLLWNPYALAFDVGFQLSFLATLGLILISPRLSEKLSLVPETIGVREFLTATLATQVFVLPLLLYQIGEFSVVAVVVNVLVLPMVPIAMLLTFMTGLVAYISTALALPLSYLTHLSLSYIIKVAEWFGSLPMAAFTVPAFPFWLVPLGYALIILGIWWANRGLNSSRYNLPV